MEQFKEFKTSETNPGSVRLQILMVPSSDKFPEMFYISLDLCVSLFPGVYL